MHLRVALLIKSNTWTQKGGYKLSNEGMGISNIVYQSAGQVVNSTEIDLYVSVRVQSLETCAGSYFGKEFEVFQQTLPVILAISSVLTSLENKFHLPPRVNK